MGVLLFNIWEKTAYLRRQTNFRFSPTMAVSLCCFFFPERLHPSHLFQMEKHRCRICSRHFQCGRSLGGHMRSHMRFYSIEAEKGKIAGEEVAHALRENPKHRKECGEEFPSSKALFGHMRCRSDNIISQRSQEVEQKDDQEQDQEEEEEGPLIWHKFFHDSMSDDNVPAAESQWNRRSILAPTAIRSSSTTAYE